MSGFGIDLLHKILFGERIDLFFFRNRYAASATSISFRATAAAIQPQIIHRADFALIEWVQ
jgi:hypothetical protein